MQALVLFFILVPFFAFSQTPSKQALIDSVESYSYATISLDNVLRVGFSSSVQAFPAGFSVTSVCAELLANVSEGR